MKQPRLHQPVLRHLCRVPPAPGAVLLKDRQTGQERAEHGVFTKDRRAPLCLSLHNPFGRETTTLSRKTGAREKTGRAANLLGKLAHHRFKVDQPEGRILLCLYCSFAFLRITRLDKKVIGTVVFRHFPADTANEFDIIRITCFATPAGQTCITASIT